MRGVAVEIALDEARRNALRRLSRQPGRFEDAGRPVAPAGRIDRFLHCLRRSVVELVASLALAAVTEMCQGMTSRSASVTMPKSARPRKVSRKMPAKARSGRMLPVTIWM